METDILDAYSSYNHIKMKELDYRKITFIVDRGHNCYIVMSFRLKNVRATYWLFMIKIYNHLLRKNVDAYIKDMLLNNILNEEYFRD